MAPCILYAWIGGISASCSRPAAPSMAMRLLASIDGNSLPRAVIIRSLIRSICSASAARPSPTCLLMASCFDGLCRSKPNDEIMISSRAEWMIYGANGYTGHLVAAEARRRGLNPVLAGRRAAPIEKLAAELGLSMRVFDLDDAPAAAIAGTVVVANC